jgi:hypothetical protein
MNVIITMAGFGKRFLDAGYNVPKYQIVAHGKTLFAWSMLSLRSFIAGGARFTFVVRAADEARELITSEAAALGIASSAVIELEAPTDGQATTAMLARPKLENTAAPMLIYNIDTFVHPDAMPREKARGAGWIPCFPAAGDHWSFAAADASGRVHEVREKVRISPHATVGLYYFASFDLFEAMYEKHYKNPENLEKNERYVAPIYNTLLESGAEVFLHEVPLDAVIPLGVPADVERFLAGAPPSL